MLIGPNPPAKDPGSTVVRGAKGRVDFPNGVVIHTQMIIKESY